MFRSAVTAGYLPALREYGLDRMDLGRLSLLRFQRGEYLFRSGAAMEYLMLVVCGRAKGCRASENGRSLLLTFYSGKGMLGDIELMLGLDCATSDVQAVSECTAVGVPFSQAAELLGNHAFLLTLARGLARHVERNTQNSVATVLNPLEARLCSYLSIMDDGGLFHEKLTVLAELLGSSYRHLLRTLGSLCQRGVLLKERGGYRVLDGEALRLLGGDTYQF